MMDERPPFCILPHERRARLFGVNFAVCDMPDGGELYIAEHAWHWLDFLQPQRWWDAEALTVTGERLAGSTGTVYRVRSSPPGQRPRDLVVKFSRVAQDVPLFIPDDFVSGDEVATARFLGPFAEFGLVNELHHSVFNHGDRRLRLKVPLAVFSPPEKYPLWQTGRDESIFRAHLRAMAVEQFENGLRQVTLDIERDYLEIFAWVDGIDAEEACDRGLLTKDQIIDLTRHSNRTLARLGYRILDNKPRHLIIRQRRDGRFLSLHDQIVYTMIDFELLQRHEDAPSRRFAQKVPLG